MPDPATGEASGLGNYKGVMLCNRPGFEIKETEKPFLSRVATNEKLGIKFKTNFYTNLKI